MSRATSARVAGIKAAPAATAPQPAFDRPFPAAPLTPRAVVDLLLSVAGPKLSSAELAAIVKGGAGYVERAAEHAAEVAEGLGCLVAHDADNGPGAGNFQRGESVAVLMWHMQAHLEGVAAMASAVSWAAVTLESNQSEGGAA